MEGETFAFKKAFRISSISETAFRLFKKGMKKWIRNKVKHIGRGECFNLQYSVADHTCWNYNYNPKTTLKNEIRFVPGMNLMPSHQH